MVNVYWVEQAEADVPEHDAWLSAGELARLSRMKFAKRRTDWRLGRWTAKRAVAAYLKVPADCQTLAGIEVLPAASGAPEVFLAGKPAEVCISLSHRAGIAACAIGPCGSALGCDLEVAEPRSDVFVADYFTVEEQALVLRAPISDRPWITALLWSAKESALKALQEGLRLDTRSVVVSGVEAHSLLRGSEGAADLFAQTAPLISHASGSVDPWHPMRVAHSSAPTFQGWWQNTGDLVRTLVASPEPFPPIFL